MLNKKDVCLRFFIDYVIITCEGRSWKLLMENENR